MADTLDIQHEPATMTPVQLGENAADPFKDWSETPPAQMQTTTAQPAATTTTTTTATTTEPEETFDEEDYLKNNFGFQSREQARTELERLRNLEKNPVKEEIKFENDESKRIFDLIKSGKPEKIKELRDYFDRQDRLDRITQYDLSKAEQAADILKAHLQFKNPDLTPKEVDRLINRKFSFPEKPANNLDLTPEENQAAIQAWETKVREIEEDMIIEAKLVRPELSQFKSNLVLPDIQPPVDPVAAEAKQKELQQWQTSRNNYLTSLNRDLQSFNGFTFTYKDNEVEYQIPFTPSDQEKAQLKEQLSDFNRDQFLDQRWFDEAGNPKINEIAADIYLLQNRDKIMQKFVNESSAKMLAHIKKNRANITVGQTPQGTFQPNNLTEQEKQEAAIWSA